MWAAPPPPPPCGIAGAAGGRAADIMASGKSYEDIRQALRELGITPDVAAKIGLRLYKIGMPWPLEPEGVRQFAVGLEEIFIVEERSEIVVKQELFNWRDDVRPRIVGKMDDHDKRFLTFAAELTVASLASSLTERLLPNVALGRIETMRFELETAVWDQEKRTLVVFTVANLNGKITRAAEAMEFDAAGRQRRGRAYYGYVLD